MMPQDAADEIGAPLLCPHHRAVIRSMAHLDHIGDEASTLAAQHIAKQCPACRKDQP